MDNIISLNLDAAELHEKAEEHHHRAAIHRLLGNKEKEAEHMQKAYKFAKQASELTERVWEEFQRTLPVEAHE